jgi:ureidoglycolate lyase
MNAPENRILIQPISAAGFAPFGDLLRATGQPDKIINQGLCGRYHDLAQMDFSDGRAGLSLFNAEPRALPMPLQMMERHPEGSQAFIPMSEHGFLVIVAPVGRWPLRPSRDRW